jgi:hypothetical protein
VLLIVFINYGYNFKIFWRFNAHFSKFVNPVQSSKNISKVLDHLKLGLNDETTPDSLTHKDIGKSVGLASLKYLRV